MASSLKTRFVNKDDYRNFCGVDLELELKDNDNGSNKVNTFIVQVENWCETYINYHSAKLLDYTTLTADQLVHWKRGIMYQMEYILRNGDISSDSGYEPTQGAIIDTNYLEKISLAQNAKMEFNMAGVFTRKLRSKYGFRYTDIY